MEKGRIELSSYYGIQKEIGRYGMFNAQQYAIVASEWLKNQNLEPYFDVNEIQGEVQIGRTQTKKRPGFHELYSCKYFPRVQNHERVDIFNADRT